MSLKFKVIASLLCVAAAFPSVAEEKKSSVSFSGNYSKPSGYAGSGNVNAGYGRLIGSNLELGASVSEFISNGTTTTGLGVNAQYYFGAVGKAGSTLPYVKAGVSTFSGGGSSFTRLSVSGGVAYEMTESAEAFIEVGETSQKIGGSRSSGTELNLGLKYRF